MKRTKRKPRFFDQVPADVHIRQKIFAVFAFHGKPRGVPGFNEPKSEAGRMDFLSHKVKEANEVKEEKEAKDYDLMEGEVEDFEDVVFFFFFILFLSFDSFASFDSFLSSFSPNCTSI
jgi:hypothetical protein